MKDKSRVRAVTEADFALSELQIYACRNENQLARYYEPEPGLFIAESVNVVQRALDAGYAPCSFLVEEGLAQERAWPILARCPGVTVYTAPPEVLDKLSGFHLTGGLLCAMRRKPPADIAPLLSSRRLAVLEGITNPTNVGAIFRSAAALGMGGVLLCRGCADPLQRRCIRVSMGTVFQIPWGWLPWDPQGSDRCQANVGYLRQYGFRTIAMALDENAVPLDRLRLGYGEKAAVLLGSEGYGLTPETVHDCDDVVMIPMFGAVDSLNVAAASAVAFWEICRNSTKNTKAATA